MDDFQNRVAVVSGAAVGLGKAIAADGADALVDLDETGLAETTTELEATGSRVLAIVANVSTPEDVEAAVNEFDRQIAVNLRGTHLCLSRVLPGMVERERRAVMNVASVAAIHATAPHAGYAASKAGIISMAKELGFEVARSGVRVNCVAPGLIAVPPSATKVPYLKPGQVYD